MISTKLTQVLLILSLFPVLFGCSGAGYFPSSCRLSNKDLNALQRASASPEHTDNSTKKDLERLFNDVCKITKKADWDRIEYSREMVFVRNGKAIRDVSYFKNDPQIDYGIARLRGKPFVFSSEFVSEINTALVRAGGNVSITSSVDPLTSNTLIVWLSTRQPPSSVRWEVNSLTGRVTLRGIPYP